MEISQVAFLDSDWKASLFQSLGGVALFGTSKDIVTGSKIDGLQQSQIILWGHGGWDRNLCLSWDSQLVLAISQSIHSPGNFYLLLVDETNPASQSLSLDGKTISSPTSSMHKMLGPAALHLLAQPHSRTNTALWAIYILFKPTLGNKVMHNPCSASLLCTRFTLPRQDLISLGLTMQRMSKTFESHLKKTERPNP